MYDCSCTYIPRAAGPKPEERKQMDDQWQVEVARNTHMNNYSI